LTLINCLPTIISATEGTRNTCMIKYAYNIINIMNSIKKTRVVASRIRLKIHKLDFALANLLLPGRSCITADSSCII
jgi:hypothetical protein